MKTHLFLSVKTIVLISTFLFCTLTISAQNGSDVKTGLRAQWQFEETTDTIIDEFNFTNGSIMDTSIHRIEGLNGNALSFNKTVGKGFVQIANSDSIEFDSTQSFTISALLKCDFTNQTGEMYILIKGTYQPDHYPGGSGKWVALSYKNVPEQNRYRELRFTIDDNLTKTQASSNLPADFDGSTWHHFVCVRDINNMSLSLFVDGVQFASSFDLTSHSIESGLPMLIGNYYDSTTPYQGSIDDLRIYSCALPQDSITALYESYNLASKPSSINNEKSNSQKGFSYFPNPARNNLHILCPSVSIGQKVQLFSMDGKVLLTQNINTENLHIDLAGYKKGIYLLRINNEVEKLIIE